MAGTPLLTGGYCRSEDRHAPARRLAATGAARHKIPPVDGPIPPRPKKPAAAKWCG